MVEKRSLESTDDKERAGPSMPAGRKAKRTSCSQKMTIISPVLPSLPASSPTHFPIDHSGSSCYFHLFPAPMTITTAPQLKQKTADGPPLQRRRKLGHSYLLRLRQGNWLGDFPALWPWKSHIPHSPVISLVQHGFKLFPYFPGRWLRPNHSWRENVLVNDHASRDLGHHRINRASWERVGEGRSGLSARGRPRSKSLFF